MVRVGGGIPRLVRLLDSKDWPTLVHCTNGPHVLPVSEMDGALVLGGGSIVGR